MTAQATLQSAMQAVNEGAFYYIQKPFRNDELVAILRRAAEHRMLRVENTTLKKEIRRREVVVGLDRAGGQPNFRIVRDVEHIAPHRRRHFTDFLSIGRRQDFQAIGWNDHLDA